LALGLPFQGMSIKFKTNKIMKQLLFIILVFFYFSFPVAMAQKPEEFKKIEVKTYAFKPTKDFIQFRIPLSFANAILPKSCIPDSLVSKKIMSVKLIYTRYKESKSFDQDKLNQQRISNLVSSNPTLFKGSTIKWYFVEQTLEDSIKAKTLFHGFEIIYQNKPPQKDYAMTDKIFNTKAIPSISFKINTNKDTVLKGVEGTTVNIQRHCFLDENNKPYKGEVNIELKEAIKMESIILANLVTMTDGNALESGGMIFIDAKTKAGKSLKIDPLKPINASIASPHEVDPDMQLWEAEKQGNLMNWKNPQPLNGADTDKDAIRNEESSVKEMEKNLNFQRRKIQSEDDFIEHVQCWCTENPSSFYYFKLLEKGQMNVQLFAMNKNYENKLVSDTLYDANALNNKNIELPKPKGRGKDCFTKIYLKNNKLDYLGKVPMWNDSGFNFKEPVSKEYLFQLSKVGNWANIDCLANDRRTRPVDFIASLPVGETYSDVSFYMVFKDRNIFIPGYRSQNKPGYGFSHGDYEIPRLPVGARATILCICYKNGKPYMAMKDIVISLSQNIVMNPEATTDDGIKKRIKQSF